MSIWLIILCVVGYLVIGLAIGILSVFDKMNSTLEVIAWLAIYPLILIVVAIIALSIIIWMPFALLYAFLKELIN